MSTTEATTLASLKPGDKVIECVPSIRASGNTTRSLRTIARRTKYLLIVNGTSYSSADGKPHFRQTKSWLELGTSEELARLETEQAETQRRRDETEAKRRAESTHTPTPFYLAGDMICATVQNVQAEVATVHGDAEYIGRLEAQANAEFIVRACNQHASLVSALRVAREELFKLGETNGSDQSVLDECNAAIARRDAIYAQIDKLLAGEAG